MNRQTAVVAGGLIIAILAGMFLFMYLKRAEVARQAAENADVPATQEGMDITRIDAKHFYTAEQGVHTLAGEIMMPTACDLLRTNAVLLDDGARAVVSFDVINNSPGECENAPTSQRFKIGFKAAETIAIEATYKGKPVQLNLIPAGEGESPADFELFIKG